MSNFKLSKYQQAICQVFEKTNKNLIINAVAGAGKTSTLIQLLSLVPTNKSILFLAFNKSIVEELKKRTKNIDGLDIMTLHSCGWSSIQKRYGYNVKMNEKKSMGKVEKAFNSFPDLKSIHSVRLQRIKSSILGTM